MKLKVFMVMNKNFILPIFLRGMQQKNQNKTKKQTGYTLYI